MGEANKLVLLLNKVCNIVITGDLQLPILEGLYLKEQIDSGEEYDQSIIVNISIDGMKPTEFIIKLSSLTSDCLRHLRSKYDSETNLNKKKRLIRDDIQLSERGISLFNSRTPQIKINNLEDVKKLRVIRYNEIQKTYFNHVAERVIATSLTLLKQEISIELNDAVVREVPPVLQVRLSGKQEEPTKFEDLFRNAQNGESSIAILRELSAPVVDSEYNYIGNNKGIICVWIDCLKINGIMLKYTNHIYTKLLNEKINKLDLGGSEFTHTYKNAELKRGEIQDKISKFSQLGRLGK